MMYKVEHRRTRLNNMNHLSTLTKQPVMNSKFFRNIAIFLPLLALYIFIPVWANTTPTGSSDEHEYLDFAENLTQGYYTNSEELDLWFGPGLPIILAPLVALDLPLIVIRLQGSLFLFATIIVFNQFLRLYLHPTNALLGAYALGLYFPSYRFLDVLWTESLTLFLVTLSMYALVLYLRQGQRRFLFLSAFSLAYITMTKVAFGWIFLVMFGVFLVMWLIRSSSMMMKKLVMVMGVALVFCIPWLTYTYSLTGKVFYWGSAGGLSLYWMASPNPDDLGDWQSVSRVMTMDELTPHRDFFSSIEDLDQVERNSALMAKSIENIQQNPAGYIRNIGFNLSRMWFSFPYSYSELRVTSLFFIVPNSILLVSLLSALFILWKQRQQLPIELLPFGLFALGIISLHMLVSAYARMLIPAVPILYWIIIYAFKHVNFRFIPKLNDNKESI